MVDKIIKILESANKIEEESCYWRVTETGSDNVDCIDIKEELYICIALNLEQKYILNYTYLNHCPIHKEISKKEYFKIKLLILELQEKEQRYSINKLNNYVI